MIRRKARVLVRHRVHAEPRRHQSILQVSGAVVCLPSLMRQIAVACEQVRWTCEPSSAKFPTLQIQAKGVFLLAGEGEGEKPTDLNAVYIFGFMCCVVQIDIVIFGSYFTCRQSYLTNASICFLLPYFFIKTQ